MCNVTGRAQCCASGPNVASMGAPAGGTDLDVVAQSGQADACADALLGGAEVEQLPV